MCYSACSWLLLTVWVACIEQTLYYLPHGWKFAILMSTLAHVSYNQNTNVTLHLNIDSSSWLYHIIILLIYLCRKPALILMWAIYKKKFIIYKAEHVITLSMIQMCNGYETVHRLLSQHTDLLSYTFQIYGADFQ